MAESKHVVEVGAEEDDGNMEEVLETEGEHFQCLCLLSLWKAGQTLSKVCKNGISAVVGTTSQIHWNTAVPINTCNYPFTPVFAACWYNPWGILALW